MSKRLLLNFAITFAIAGLFTVADVAQTSSKGKGYFLHATVEQVNDFAQTIRVKQERIAGYSDARIATYNVDDAAILKKLQVGDKIAATIYDKDNTLHDIQVVKIYDTFPRSIK
jgi:Cu/Ag efflux protein CusF